MRVQGFYRYLMEQKQNIFEQLQHLKEAAHNLYKESAEQQKAAEEYNKMFRVALNLVLKVSLLPEEKLPEIKKECEQFVKKYTQLIETLDQSSND
jgi:predicted  nucleic acid-binding Zn-ribbon protein